MKNRRVVITGMGMVTPAGMELEEIWNNIIKCRSAIAKISSFDLSGFSSSLGGEVAKYDITKFIDNRKSSKLFRKDVCYCMAAARLAYHASGIDFPNLNPADIGLYIGSGESEVRYNEFFSALDYSMNADGSINFKKLGTLGLRYFNPFFLLEDLCNSGLCYLSIEYGIVGANNNFSGGISSGHAIGEGYRAIQRGDCEVVVAGGHDSLVSCFGSYFLHEARGHFTTAEDPACAMMPYSIDRSGFAPAEGAGIVILEEIEFARKRNANILAELVGYHNSCDTHDDLLNPDPEGNGMAGAIQGALNDAGIQSSQLDYINSVGDATVIGDISETRAIKKILGHYAYIVPVSTVKPIIGHTGTAADVIEFIVTTLALQKGIIPPTLNYLGGDAECDLDYTSMDPRETPMEYAMALGRGYGGQNSAFILKRSISS